MGDVVVTVEEKWVTLKAPFNADLAPAARDIGGWWVASAKVWRFDLRDESRVRNLCREIYGSDGSPEESGDVVTVQIQANLHSEDGKVMFAGRRVAERKGRDDRVRLASGTVLVAGSFPGAGGSMRYPSIAAGDDVVLEIRDLPRSALRNERDYKIVGESIDREVLVAERNRLTARLQEINALLGD